MGCYVMDDWVIYWARKNELKIDEVLSSQNHINTFRKMMNLQLHYIGASFHWGDVLSNVVSLLHHFPWALVWVIFCLFHRRFSSRLPCVNTRSITKPLNKYSTSKYCFATYTPSFLIVLLKYKKNTASQTPTTCSPYFSDHFDMHLCSQSPVNYLLTMFARRKNITLFTWKIFLPLLSVCI